MREAAPILVAGLDHSGKTALKAALDAHPAIRMVRHVELWTRLRAWFLTGPSGRRRAVMALTSGKAAALGLDHHRLTAAAASADFGALVREVGRQVCEAAGTTRWGLQEALLEFQAASVLQELPEARVIQLVRDPRARFAEMRERGAVGRGGLAAETAAWVASARAGLGGVRSNPDAYRVVRCESLADADQATMRDLVAFIGEPFEAAMMATLPAPVGVPQLTPREVAFVQAHAGPELRALGYALQSVRGEPSQLSQRLADASRWQLGRLSWRRRARHLRPSLASERG